MTPIIVRPRKPNEGKYDELVKQLGANLGAAGIFLFIIGGKKGDGWSFDAPSETYVQFRAGLPAVLRGMADAIDKANKDLVVETTGEPQPEPSGLKN